MYRLQESMRQIRYIAREVAGGIFMAVLLIGTVIIGLRLQVGLQIDCIGLTDPAPYDDQPALVDQDTYAAGFRLDWLRDMPMPEVTPVEAETVQAAPDRWTPEEQELLAHLVMAEAEGEPLDGKIAVINVVDNRCRIRGQSVEDVIFAPRQFCTGARFDLEPTAECWEAVRQAMDGETVVPKDVEYFCERSLRFKQLEYVGRIGHHLFWKEKEPAAV